MTQDGSDLFWLASDGSSVLTHVFNSGYQQGNSLKDYCANRDWQGAIKALQYLLKTNLPPARTGYVYIPCGDDFALPIPCLLEIANAWNSQQAASGQVVVGTLDQYIRLVLAWSNLHPASLVKRTMNPPPYWTGFYASRPANKILHHSSVRALLGAEAFGTMADLLQTADQVAWLPIQAARRKAAAQAWEALMPSTHHDYITGTAVDSVYTEEQLPLLRAAQQAARGACDTALQEIAGLVLATPRPGEEPILVANQAGFRCSGIIEVSPVPGQRYSSARTTDGVVSPVQVADDGRQLFLGSAPGLGYTTYYLSPSSAQGGTVKATLQSGSAVLENSLLRIELSQARDWAITSFLWRDAQGLQFDMVPQGQAANELVFYKDGGGLYNFGNELGLTFGPEPGLTPSSVTLLEGGPLRARLRVTATFKSGTAWADYAIEYELVTGEPFVRIAITGSAPYDRDPNNLEGQGYAVMVRIPFADPARSRAPVRVDGVLRGTPYHWDNALPVAYWQGPTFQAAHNFVVPTYQGATLGALYHADLPAWAIDPGGAMLGCVLRNSPANDGRGAAGIDHGVHRRGYALRIPGGLSVPPASGQVFQEALAYSTPLHGARINVPNAGISPDHPVTVSFPESFPLASIASGNAVITAAKRGQFDPEAVILRIYQWSNRAVPVTLSLEGYIKATGDPAPVVRQVTALEQPIAGANPLPISGGRVTFTAQRALATLAVTRGTSASSS